MANVQFQHSAPRDLPHGHSAAPVRFVIYWCRAETIWEGAVGPVPFIIRLQPLSVRSNDQKQQRVRTADLTAILRKVATHIHQVGKVKGLLKNKGWRCIVPITRSSLMATCLIATRKSFSGGSNVVVWGRSSAVLYPYLLYSLARYSATRGTCWLLVSTSAAVCSQQVRIMSVVQQIRQSTSAASFDNFRPESILRFCRTRME